LLGYPDAAVRDNDNALKDAREIGQAQTLMLALLWASWAHVWCGNYETRNSMKKSLWRTKKMPRTGRHTEQRSKGAYSQ
jgi:hypothetical protein